MKQSLAPQDVSMTRRAAAANALRPYCVELLS